MIAAEDEARILRTVAAAIRGGFVPGYHSMGGPQDGDSYPETFDSERAANELDAAALEALKPCGARPNLVPLGMGPRPLDELGRPTTEVACQFPKHHPGPHADRGFCWSEHVGGLSV